MFSFISSGNNIRSTNGVGRKDSKSIQSYNRDSTGIMLSNLDINDNLGPNIVRTGQSTNGHSEDKERNNSLSWNSLATLVNGYFKRYCSSNHAPLIINQIPLVSFQLIPNKYTKNDNINLLFKSVDNLYQSLLSRIYFNNKNKQIIYTPLSYIVWEIWFVKKKILFFIHIRKDYEEYFKHKLSLVWPKIEIQQVEPVCLPIDSFVWEVELKNHFIFPLNIRKRSEEYLALLFDTVKILNNEDIVVLQIIIEPLGISWKDKGYYFYQQLKQGIMPQRIESKTPLYYFSLILHPIIYELIYMIGEFFGAKIENDYKHNIKPSYNIQHEILNKIKYNAYEVNIRIGVHTNNQAKANIISQSIVSFLDMFEGENGFKIKKLSNKYVFKINNREKNNFKINQNILNSNELSQIIMLPSLSLQNEFPEIEKVGKQEIILPKIIVTKGLLIGHVKYRDKKQEVYLPIDNYDELCLPHVVIGGMGTGKTSFGANLAIEAIKNNMGAIVIDPAKGEAGNEIELVVPKSQIVRIKFGQKKYCLDWKEALHGERGRNRLANEILGFFETASDEIGIQTSRFLRAAAKTVPNSKLKEVIELLINQSYRRKLLPQMRPQEKEIWENFNSLSEARQNQIIHPILNRLDIIYGDDYLAECLEENNSIDFVELLNQPKVIILDIPKSDLGTEAVDILATLMITKINLAMVLRKTSFPVFVIQDEPHQYMKSYKIWKSVAVESRKWRFSFVWMFHAWEQLPRDLVSIIRSTNPHYHIYSSSEFTFRALAEEISPLDLRDALNMPRHYAINIIRAGGKTITPFIAKMLPPPSYRLKAKPIELEPNK